MPKEESAEKSVVIAEEKVAKQSAYLLIAWATCVAIRAQTAGQAGNIIAITSCVRDKKTAKYKTPNCRDLTAV